MPTIEQARRWYPDDDHTHGFSHILRVLALAEDIARQEGADWRVVRAAVLLHDAQEGEAPRKSHHLGAADFARKVLTAEGWEETDIQAVEHCIRTHRFRDQEEAPRSLEARVLFDADKLDAIGGVGVMRAVAYAVQRGEPLYVSPSDAFLETGKKEPGEPHTPYHEYHYKLRHLAGLLHTEAARRLAQNRQRVMAVFFDGLLEELPDRLTGDEKKINPGIHRGGEDKGEAG